MITRGSKLYSVLHGVCARCQQSKIFKYGPYQLVDFDVMHEHCEHCGQAFEPEPGFYQGAMYVSYGLSLGVSFVMGILLMFVFDVNLWIASLVFTLFLLGLLPVIFRVSRVIWLNLFVSYRPLDSEKTPLA